MTVSPKCQISNTRMRPPLPLRLRHVGFSQAITIKPECFVDSKTVFALGLNGRDKADIDYGVGRIESRSSSICSA